MCKSAALVKFDRREDILLYSSLSSNITTKESLFDRFWCKDYTKPWYIEYQIYEKNSNWVPSS